MSRGYWLQALALGLILGGTAMAQSPKGQGVTVNHPTDASNEFQNSDSNADRAQPKILVPKPTVEVAKIIQNTDEARQDKAGCIDCDRKDLEQQTRMADAADRQVVVGVVVAILTLFAAGATAWAAWAAARAANSADKSVAQADKQAAQELRAYLSVEPRGINQLIKRDEGIGQVAVKNVGKIPARNVQVIVKMKIADDRNIAVEDPGTPEASDRTIHPDAEMLQGSKKEHPKITEICVPNKYVFVWGRVLYEDGFGNPRVTNFCHRYSTSSFNRRDDWNTPAKETRVIIDRDKARYHSDWNDAD
jgi:hypothetical protein